MTTWAPANLGANISQIVSQDDTQDDAMRSNERGTTAPPYPTRGQFWARTDFPTISESICYRKADDTWTLLMDPDYAQINAGGTVAFAANQALGGFIITGSGAATAAGHLTRYEQVMLLTGVNAMAADLNMNSHKITNVTTPSAGGDGANKTYVDAAAAAVGTVTASATTTGASFAQTCSVALGFNPSTVVLCFTGGGSTGTGSLGAVVFPPGVSVAYMQLYEAFNTTATITQVTITRTGSGIDVAFNSPRSGIHWTATAIGYR